MRAGEATVGPRLLLCLSLAAPLGCAGVPRADRPPESGEGGSCSFHATPEQARVASARALEALGYALESCGVDEIVARSAAQRRFFGWLGEQSKQRVVTLRLRTEARGRTRVEAALVLVHGAPDDGSSARESIRDERWYERLFERVRLELMALEAERTAA